MSTPNTEGFIPPHGGYRHLITYQKAEIIYDGTVYFTRRFREINRTPNATYETYQKALENPEPAICANSEICLINVVSYLLNL